MLGRRGPRLQKKLGEVVYKGNPSYALMANLQLGIRYSVGRGPWPPATHSSSWLGFASGFGGTGGSGQQQQQWEKGDKGGHRRQLSDALSGQSIQLTPADYRDKRSLYFPTDGRWVCVACVFFGGEGLVLGHNALARH